MNEKTKNNLLKELKKNVDLTLKKMKKEKINKKTIDKKIILKEKDSQASISEMSYLTNNGDIRSIEIYVYTKNEKNKVANFVIRLEDKSIGSGLYNKLERFEDYGKFNKLERQPYCWQYSSFTSIQTKELQILEKKGDSYGEDIEFIKEIDEVLSELYKEFWRSEKDLEKYYTEKNKKLRLKAFDKEEIHLLKNKEEIKYFEAKYKESNYFSKNIKENKIVKNGVFLKDFKNKEKKNKTKINKLKV